MIEKKKTFSRPDKKKAAVAIAVTAAMLIITALAAAGEGVDAPFLVLALLLAFGAGAFVLCPFSYGRILSGIFYILLPFAAFAALENYTHVLTDLDIPIVVLNLAFFYLLYGLAVFLLGSVRLGFEIATLVPMIFGLANYYVVSFRSSPIVPWDFLSLGTAMSVADNYTFTLTWKAAFVVMSFVWIILLASKSSVKIKRMKLRIPTAFLCALLLCVYISGIQKSSVQSFFGMDTTLFTLNVPYRNNGIAAAFLGNLRFLNVEEPVGYSAERAQEIAEQVKTEGAKGKNGGPESTSEAGNTDSENSTANSTANSASSGAAAEYPNIVVIMDEAFSDLSVWGDFETSEDVIPFFKSLQEEAVGGEVYVSVKGGNTANTEFEFLTGDTMGFLPVGSVPYQQYIHGETPSLAWYLKSMGYDTTAIHPYNASGWDRDEVYEDFGFDEFLSVKDFDDPLRMRGYVSDRAAFGRIIEEFEQKDEQQRAFIFEVTMQNHGGYSKPSPDFDSYLKLTEVSSKTTSVLATEKYLTLMNETDRALQDLILYFQEQDEPVIVLMFGDHQPSDYITNVIQRICGVQSQETLDYVQQGYRVPFMMWSNYGLEHEYYDGISVNYLGGILMQNAGIPLTGYQQFLSNLMETLPVVNGNVYRDSEGTFYSYGGDEYADILNEYKILQYNHLVDGKHRIPSFFGQ
ncbi:MAG: sulfatase-like hydrolase/transferase [Lachnospiraceae bacterium]|nr:sulfatase-like hydrolase/transferase [Lachnospiraceae bacterium]